MILLLCFQAPFEGFLILLLVPLVLAPIGACCQMILYGLVAHRRGFGLLDGVLAGAVTAFLFLAIMLACREPFFGFVAAYLVPSCVIVGGAAALAVYPESRAAARLFVRRAFGGPGE